MKFNNIRELIWADSTKTSINCVVDIDGIGEGLPYTASITDVNIDGQNLFMSITENRLAEIAEYVGPVTPVLQPVDLNYSFEQIPGE